MYIIFIWVFISLLFFCLNCSKDQLPFYVILIGLVGLVWGLDIVALPNHGDVTLDITFTPGGDVIRVGQDGPLMIKLVLWERHQSFRTTHCEQLMT